MKKPSTEASEFQKISGSNVDLFQKYSSLSSLSPSAPSPPLLLSYTPSSLSSLSSPHLPPPFLQGRKLWKGRQQSAFLWKCLCKGLKITNLEWSCCIITQQSPGDTHTLGLRCLRNRFSWIWEIICEFKSLRRIWWQILAGQSERKSFYLGKKSTSARSSWVLSLHKSSNSLRLTSRVVRWVTRDCLTEKFHVTLFLSQSRNS